MVEDAKRVQLITSWGTFAMNAVMGRKFGIVIDCSPTLDCSLSKKSNRISSGLGLKGLVKSHKLTARETNLVIRIQPRKGNGREYGLKEDTRRCTNECGINMRYLGQLFTGATASSFCVLR